MNHRKYEECNIYFLLSSKCKTTERRLSKKKKKKYNGKEIDNLDNWFVWLICTAKSMLINILPFKFKV